MGPRRDAGRRGAGHPDVSARRDPHPAPRRAHAPAPLDERPARARGLPGRGPSRPLPRTGAKRAPPLAGRADLPGRGRGQPRGGRRIAAQALDRGLRSPARHERPTVRAPGPIRSPLADRAPDARGPRHRRSHLPPRGPRAQGRRARRRYPRRPGHDALGPRPFREGRGGAGRVPGPGSHPTRRRSAGRAGRLRRPRAGEGDRAPGPGPQFRAQDLGRRGAEPPLRRRPRRASLPTRRPGAVRLGSPRARPGSRDRSPPRRRHRGPRADVRDDLVPLESGQGRGVGGRRQRRRAPGLVGVAQGRRGARARAGPVPAVALRHHRRGLGSSERALLEAGTAEGALRDRSARERKAFPGARPT